MALVFRWNDSLETGIEKIDKQHRRLVSLMEEMHTAIREERWNDEKTADLLQELYLYAAIHFRAEEEMMQEAGYPDLEGHLREHDVFRNKIRQLDDCFREGRKGVIMELTAFLRDWLYQHISHTDMKYVAHIRRNQ